MPDEGAVGSAARRLIEFDTIQRKLTDAANQLTNAEETCTVQYDAEFSGTRQIKTLLNEVEWSCYQYSSLLHMLGEMIDRTHDEFGTRLRNHAEIRHELPKLIGLRNAIHHNGLVGLNITQIGGTSHVIIPTVSIRRHGNWGAENSPDFETFFHSAGDAIVVASTVTNSKPVFEAIIRDMTSAITKQFDEETLRQRASNLDVYATQS